MPRPHLTVANARRRADRLAYTAETIGDHEPCRDVAPEQNALRRAAAHADQPASAAVAAARRPLWRDR
jgi:hypothetical protein